jgi:hypothetical protein
MPDLERHAKLAPIEKCPRCGTRVCRSDYGTERQWFCGSNLCDWPGYSSTAPTRKPNLSEIEGHGGAYE